MRKSAGKKPPRNGGDHEIARAPRGFIVIRGAREHNLKGIDVDIPRGRLVVVTGVSGSGKSSLALDTIYAEGQRRYVESLSSHARRFLEKTRRPVAERIDGLSPAIAVQARPLGATPRSTVATATEIHDHLRLLYSRIGTPHCARCGAEVRRRTVQEIVDGLIAAGGGRVLIAAPLVEGEEGDHRELFERLSREGFVRVRVDGRVTEIEKAGPLDPEAPHTVELIVDRVEVKPSAANRLSDSVELALRMGNGRAMAIAADGGSERSFTERMVCEKCGKTLPDFEPHHFSFNSPRGACPACHGLGRRLRFAPELVIDRSRSLSEGAVLPFRCGPRSLIIRDRALLRAVARHYGFSPDVPFGRLERRWKRIVMEGSRGEPITLRYWRGRRPCVRKAPFEGVLAILERRFARTESAYMRRRLRPFMRESPCSACGGLRLRPESLAVTLGGKNIGELVSLSVSGALAFLAGLELPSRAKEVGGPVLGEVLARLGFMEKVGLGYLTLDRESATLSGGEAQRVRLATQIGSRLTGVIYVLDEPSIGLHMRDTGRLLDSLAALREQGNTVIVIEHDEQTIRSADHVVDLGPGAGIHGGRLVAAGRVEEICANRDSLTGRYLSGESFIPLPGKRRSPSSRRRLRLAGASHNNLKDITVDLPLGLFCCVTGVSGAGKSSLVDDTLRKALAARLQGSREQPGRFRSLSGVEHLNRVVVVDQSPIGRTPRSNPATYAGIYGHVRALFARHPEARARGYGPGRFSFNVKGGRCEACRGDGVIRVDMEFLPDVYVTCDACGGSRYNRETLEIRFKGSTIADVLAMTVEEAAVFFRRIPPLERRLGVLADVGLGYITLGQPATTLSGGESQRLKLARELGRAPRGRTLYILDEPTTGLHFADVGRLIDVLQRLVEAGNTMLVVEHNMEVIKCADWVIDLGPGGGDEGGYVVAEGPPEAIAACADSHTGRYLRRYLE